MVSILNTVRFALLTFFSGKTENFRHEKRCASRLETASVIKIVTEKGRVRYGTVLWINSDLILFINNC